MTIELLIRTAILAAYDAGQAILEVYSQDFSIAYKQDLSPLTEADLQANRIISGYLKNTEIPILSEEGAEIPFNERKDWMKFWLVDPLDGTKEFIKKNGDFTVNIALITDNGPSAGVIYAPVPDLVYFGLTGYGSFKIDGNILKQNLERSLPEIIQISTRLPEIRKSNDYIIIASRSHPNKETADLIQKIKESRNDVTYLSRGSSLKFCAVAEGSADFYPRMGPTMEWDTAAGHAIAVHAGCTVNQLSSSTPLVYNKESLLNPYFVVERI